MSFLSFGPPKNRGGVGPDSARSLFHNFRRLLEQNTAALEQMADMERALGGEYIFDGAFLRRSTQELSRLVQRSVHCLNGMSDNRYLDLYDRFQVLYDHIEDLLAGGPGPDASLLTLGFDRAGWDAQVLVGAPCAMLAELGHHFGLPVADGFAVTRAAAGRLLFAQDPGLSAEIAKEVRRLFRRLGRERPLEVFVSPDPAGRPEILVPVKNADAIFNDLHKALAAYLTLHPEEAAAPPAMGVREALVPVVTGTLETQASVGGAGNAMAVTAAAPERPDALERHLVSRIAPFLPLRSEIAEKTTQAPLPDGKTSLSRTSSGILRGSALLAPEWLARLAEVAMAAERILGLPHDIRWSFSAKGRLLLQSFSPSALRTPAVDPQDPGVLEEPLVRGGETAQVGVAAGRVMHVDETTEADHFPLGAVAVARAAVPKLSAVLRRAAAVVTEIGTATGHLATIAREFRVPALFGLRGARTLLEPDQEVTVDATGRAVYRGIVEPLLEFRSQGMELDPSDPEYLLLRRILRHIVPLNLTDPASPSFSVEGCRSYHDILHFAHEKAMAELVDIQGRHPGLHSAHTRRLALDVPMDIRVLDTGGGVAQGAGSRIEMGQIRCAPLSAFLTGLTAPGSWSQEPAALGVREVIGGMRRSFELLSRPAESAYGNLAIVSELSLNLSLRLGYHFSVIDAHLSNTPGQNTVYFRFVGGLADERRRERRARLIRLILEGLGFLVESKGDLVTARIKGVSREDMDQILVRLGELTAFTRQMDTAMGDEADVQRLGNSFLQLSVGRGTGESMQ